MKQMDSKLRKMLASCIREMESGASMESCLERFPAHADALRGHLELRQSLLTGAKANPVQFAMVRGRQAMLVGLAEKGRGSMAPNFMTSTLARAAVFVVGALLLSGAAAGASAALGGPNPARDALDSVGVTNRSDNSDNSDNGGNGPSV